MALAMTRFYRCKNKTMAQLSARKKVISHRGKAIEKLRQYLEGDES